MGRTTGDIQVHRNDGVQVANHIVTAMERSTGDGTAAAGNNHLGRGNCLKGGDKSATHIPGNRPGHVDAIGMAGRGDKIDTKSGKKG